MFRGASLPPGKVAATEPEAGKLPLPVQRHRLSAWPSPGCEPSLEMVFRPEEEHVGSGVADVFVPARGRHAVVHEVLLRGPHVCLLDRDDELDVAVGAMRPNLTVDLEQRKNPERVPDTDGVPSPRAARDRERGVGEALWGRASRRSP